MLAVALALAGIVLGKYLAFVWIGQDVIDEVGFSFSLPIFSTDTVRLFWDSRSDVWGGWDLLWAGLAVLTAFRIPQHEHEQPLPETAGATAPSPQPRDEADLS